MALLKFSVQKLFKLNKIRLNCVRNIPVVTTASNSSNRPINMAYASYETTHSTDYDKTPPIILMHGLFGSKSNWNSLCKAILKKSNPRRKIIAVDARNHGESPHTDSHNYNDLASDIKHLMDRQNIKKACLMGHSMGGKAVMCFALNYV